MALELPGAQPAAAPGTLPIAPSRIAEYRGRFAPTPSGPLHEGSVVAALASWLDARAHRGRWLVRLEDTDTPRCVPGADTFILGQLQALGLLPDEEPQWQSRRTALYETRLQQLISQRLAYPCRCSRQDVRLALQARGVEGRTHAPDVYPGTCRSLWPDRSAMPVTPQTAHPTHPAEPPQTLSAWRVALQSPGTVEWSDRRLGPQQQHLPSAVGDFIVRRADGLWAYQLAVVVDDALQGITHVVRGEDLADNTPRQIHLQQLLGLPTPQYLHTPLVRAFDGQKLSKQTGATAADTSRPLHTLWKAARVLALDLPEPHTDLHDDAGAVQAWLSRAVEQWARRWGPRAV